MKTVLAAALALCTGLAAANPNPRSGDVLLPWLEDEVRRPHPIAWGVRKTLGPIAFLATPMFMWAVADKYGDKAGHCFAGFGSSLAIGLLVQPKWGFTASIAFGAAKETYDDRQPGNRWDAADLAWTVGCGAVPYLAMELRRV